MDFDVPGSSALNPLKSFVRSDNNFSSAILKLAYDLIFGSSSSVSASFSPNKSYAIYIAKNVLSILA